MTPTLILSTLLLAAPPEQVEARTIFSQHCIKCHGSDKQRGGLRLDSAAALRGGDTGPLVNLKKPLESLLLQKVKSREPSEQMPPTGERLSEKQVQALEAWIKAGAPWPDDVTPVETSHWSFQPLKRPAVTGNAIDALIQEKLTEHGLNFNPAADRRTLIRRLKFDLLGLPPTPEEVRTFEQDSSPNAYQKLVERYLASPHYGERWARHWLDVVRFAESHGFEMNQPRPNAWPYRDWVIRAFNDDLPFDQFVKAQLAGDQLGADTATGFLVAGPWDQVKSPDPVLTANQRADELHDLVSTTGSAFLGLTVGCARCHAHKFDPISQVDYYRIKAVFSGVQHGERAVKPANAEQFNKQRQALREELLQVEHKLEQYEPLADPGSTVPRRDPVNAKLNKERFLPVRAKFVRFVIYATSNLEPCLDELEVFSTGEQPRNVALTAKLRSSGDYPGSAIHQLKFVNDGQYGNSRSWISNQVGKGRVVLELPEPVEVNRIHWGRDREGKFQDRLATRYRIDVSLDATNWQVVASSDDRLAESNTTRAEPVGLTNNELQLWRKLQKQAQDTRSALAKLEQQSLVYAGQFSTPETTYRLHRGDPMAPRDVVQPGVLTEIGPKLNFNSSTEATRRMELAKWITHRENPLTARVIVNRLWQQHFGTGLVDTPSDFGRNGGKPSHPKLLDWLALELLQPSTGPAWSLKTIHRLIVLSRTYQQSSTAHEAGLKTDAQARLLWRYPPRRLDAESLRDSILFVSGSLDLRAGGPGFDLFETNTNYVRVYTPKTKFTANEFRRMIYQNKPRMQLDDTFGAFDCPDGGQIAPKRHHSTTALQALNLLNSPFLLQQADALAMRAKAKTSVAEQVQEVFQLCYLRNATDAELAGATKLVQQHGLTALARAVLNSNEFLYVD